MTAKLDHIGIVVKDLEASMELYQKALGLTMWSKGVMDLDVVRQVQLREKADYGNNWVELLEPKQTPEGRESIFGRHLRDKGEGLFHLSVFVDDFDERVQQLREDGFTVMEMSPDDLFPGHPPIRLAWLTPDQTRGVWIEFADRNSIPDEYWKL